MPDTAILTPKTPVVTPNRGLAQGQRQPTQGGEGAEAAFSALLVEVEHIAALGDQVLTQQAEALKAFRARLSGAPQNISGQTMGAAAGSLIDAAPALAAGKPLRALAPNPFALQRPQPQFTGGAVRREVLDVRPLIQPAHAPLQPINPFQNPVQNPALMAEEVQLQEQLQAPAPKLESQVAATPRLEAAIAQHANPETANPVVRQVAANLQFIARGDMERIRFDLFPEELGRVQVQLQKIGSVTRLTIVTETAHAFEALARGANGLHASLQQSGFDADDFNFEHREGRSEDGAGAEERRERRDDARRDQEQNERREVIVRPALTRADQALFL